MTKVEDKVNRSMNPNLKSESFTKNRIFDPI